MDDLNLIVTIIAVAINVVVWPLGILLVRAEHKQAQEA